MRRAIRACAAPCLFVAACGGVPAPELPVVTVETRPATSPPPVAPAVAPPVPAEPVALDEVACTWKTGVMHTREEPARLCAEGGAPCFFESVSGHFGQHDTELRIGRGAAPGALVSIPYEGMTVRGFVPAGSGAILFSVVARRKPLGGFYLPDNVRVLEGRVGEVVATADLPPGVRSASALHESLACADIHPESAWISLEEMKALVGAKDPATFVQLRAGSIPLSSAPSGPVVATIDADGSETVYAFQTSGTSPAPALRERRGPDDPEIQRIDPDDARHRALRAERRRPGLLAVMREPGNILFETGEDGAFKPYRRSNCGSASPGSSGTTAAEVNGGDRPQGASRRLTGALFGLIYSIRGPRQRHPIRCVYNCHSVTDVVPGAERDKFYHSRPALWPAIKELER